MKYALENQNQLPKNLTLRQNFYTKKMQVLLIEDHPLIRDGISMALQSLDAEVEIFVAGNCAEATSIVKSTTSLDLILLDLGLPDCNGFDCLDLLRSNDDLTPVVIISAHCEPETIRRAINFGARGFVSKNEGKDILLAALRLVIAGGIYLPHSALEASIENRMPIGLSPREYEVLQLLGEGHSNKIIARKLSIAEATVRQHATAVFKALNVKNRTEAALKAQKYLVTYS